MKQLACAGMIALIAGGCSVRGAPAGTESRLPVLAEVREYVIPWDNAFPSDVAVDSVGRVWFTDRLTHVIGMFDPELERFRSYAPPTPRSAPYGLVAGADGGLWYAASSAGLVGRVDPATGGIVEHEVGGGGGPHLLAWHGDELWFTQRETRAYGRFDPATGGTTIYRLRDHRPYSVAVSGGAVWLSGYESYQLVQVDPATGAAHIHDLRPMLDPRRSRRGEVRRIAAHGGSIWFTDLGGGRIGRYEPADPTVTFFHSIEPRAHPYGITVTSRGLVWYGEWGTNSVVVLDPVADERARVSVPTPGAYVRHLVVDEARRRVWLPLSDRGRIGLIEYRER